MNGNSEESLRSGILNDDDINTFLYSSTEEIRQTKSDKNQANIREEGKGDATERDGNITKEAEPSEEEEEAYATLDEE